MSDDGREMYMWATACPPSTQIEAETTEVQGKIRDVPDETCLGCSQNWRHECRAFCTPHSAAEEKERREGGNCQGLACMQEPVN